MPIRPDLRHLYNTPEYRAVRRRILARAGGKFAGEDFDGPYVGGARCEECGKPDRVRVWVYAGRDPLGRRVQYWTAFGRARWRDSSGALVPRAIWPAPGLPRPIWCVLTVAHRNHQAGDDRPENLAVWCQWCHLHHDQEKHKETRCTRKDRARPLLVEASPGGQNG